jgi:Antitoxin of toxin-antitoxin stability system
LELLLTTLVLYFNLKFNFMSHLADWVSSVKTVSILQFRKAAESVLKRVGKGEAFVLTYRGKPVARLEPIGSDAISQDDPIYQLDTLASSTAQPLTNAEIDRAIYGT